MAQASYDFFQLRFFIAVAEELNFRRAAARLNMTQPPLSRQIKLLEDRIGLTLFDRSNRSVRLTPAGVSFLKSATDLMQRAEYAVLTARQAERGDVGNVVMGFVPSASLHFVPQIACALKRVMPGVKFEPIEMMSYEIAEGLQSGKLDLGLTRSTAHGQEIENILLVREPFMLALPQDHPLCEKQDLSVRDLKGVDFVGYSSERGGFLKDIHRALFATVGVTPETVQEVSQTQTIVSLVNAGLGVGLVPQSAMAMRMENVVFRSIDAPKEFNSTLYLNIAPNRGTPLNEKVRATILSALQSEAAARQGAA
ncbi:LysR substrate-binding domain-containing protein [Alloyangia pacifica]|uniref:LysR substrate-binding domain-containing protein n=1 Tax=Alloyangia pacifica TaxID=311180 RepID=UPI001CD7991C|nr:LysR substrate-binding domain-containing protein [Alloyangia pacifica]MCA0996980.1 LysR family transcriptional regulator [Alloyangia pacifica]